MVRWCGDWISKWLWSVVGKKWWLLSLFTIEFAFSFIDLERWCVRLVIVSNGWRDEDDEGLSSFGHGKSGGIL